MSPPAATPTSERDFWDRSKVGWHAVYYGLLALVGIGVTADPDAASDRVIVLALLAVMAVSYAAFGARALGAERVPLALAHLVPAWAAFTVLVWREDAGYLLLFILFPQVWALLPTRLALAWTALVVAALVVVQAAAGGFTHDAVRGAVTFGLLQLALSGLLGLWITGVIRESDRRAQLIDELSRTRADLAEAERARGVLAERERLAVEIHDTLAQGLTSILTLAQAVEVGLERDPATARARLALLESTARENLAEARALVAALGPVDLAGSSLVDAIRRLAERFTAETGLPVRVDVDEPAARRLDANSEVVLLRAAQEALSNVRRHAQASSVVLRLTDGAGATTVEVVDDGRGFDPATATGFGLGGMQHRAAQVGGAVEVRSSPGAGTTVRVIVP